MLISVKDTLSISSNDIQKENVYAFDDFLWMKMNKKNLDFPKLFRGKNVNEITLEEISQNIQDDFGLNIGKLLTCQVDNYFKEGRIHLSSLTFVNKNIEILIHEYAHAFQSFLFSSHHQTSHGAEFVSILRFIMNYYDIFSYEEFDNLLVNFRLNVDCYVDFIEHFEVCSKEFFDEKNQFFKESENYDYRDSFFVSYNRTVRLTHGTEKQISHLIQGANDKYFHLIVNRCFYEYNSPFAHLSDEDLKNVVLLSSFYTMDDAGYKITANFWSGYFGYVETSIVPNLWFGHEAQRFEPDEDGKKAARKDRSERIKQLKKEGKKVIIAKSYKEYSEYYSLLRDRYYQNR